MSNELLPQAVDEYKASKIMGKSVQTLRNERHLGKGCPYIKMGKSVRYLIGDIVSYLDKHRIYPSEYSNSVTR